MIKHSFGVLAYKDSPYLAECIESLINQTAKSHIYISTSTPSEYISNIAKKYGVEVYVTETGKGVLHDNNFALQQAKTKYITLAHQDDIYLPEYAEECIASTEKFKDTLICFTNYSELMDGKERPITLLIKIKRLMIRLFMPFNANTKSKFWKTRLLSFGNPISAPTIMYNLEMLPGFQFPLELADRPNTIDWETWFTMAKKKGRFVYINKISLHRRIHADSLTSLGLEDDSRYLEDLNMFKKFWPSFIAEILAKVYANGYKSNSKK